MGSGEEVIDGGRAGIVDGSEDDVVLRSVGG